MGVFLEALNKYPSPVSERRPVNSLSTLLDQAVYMVFGEAVAAHFTINPSEDPRYKKLFQSITGNETYPIEVLILQQIRPARDGRISNERIKQLSPRLLAVEEQPNAFVVHGKNLCITVNKDPFNGVRNPLEEALLKAYRSPAKGGNYEWPQLSHQTIIA